jgi:hypothetical protein
MNRIESRFSQEACDEEANVECSSSSDDSSINSSQGVYPELDSEEVKGLKRREKRKQIQKAKKVLKKDIRR